MMLWLNSALENNVVLGKLSFLKITMPWYYSAFENSDPLA